MPDLPDPAPQALAVGFLRHRGRRGARILSPSGPAGPARADRAKILAIVGFCSEEVEVYAGQLRSLFADEIRIRSRIAGADPPSLDADADLVLFSSFDAYLLWASAAADDRAGRRALPGSPRVFAERSLEREGLDRVLAAPPGGPALVLDRTRAMAARMAAVLVQLGFRPASLEALSFDEAAAAPAAERGRTSIVFGEPERAPAGAVVDAGRCLLDVGTVIDLGIRLDLDRLLNKQSIRESYRELATPNLGLAEVLGKTNRGEASLEILLRSIGAGIVAVNAAGTVFACNERAAALAGTSVERLVGTEGAKAFPEIPFAAALEGKLPVKDGLGEHGGRIIARAVEPIVSSGALYGALAVFDTPGEEGRRRAPRERLIGTGYRARYAFSDIVGASPALSKCRDVARRMALSGSSILISGESGTGKEMFAQAIHNASARSSFPFVAVNCGALPATLLESELFGYEEGAFTGARKGGKPGLFELAHRGTLFLDEVGETPLELQLRLLRVLEEREIMRLGSDRLIGIDIRVIAATNRDLEELVASGRLREDLYYRLSVLPLRVPPLREMREDIPALLSEFMRILGRSFELSPEVGRYLREREWRGNCRELRNLVEFFASLGATRIEISDLPAPPGAAATASALGVAPKRDLDREARRFILERLAEAYAAGRRSGRRSLAALARERGLFLGEQEIRGLLLDLASRGFVGIRPGKAGTVITEAGREELSRMLKTRI